MITIQGKYNTAICYTDILDETTRQQVQDMCDQELFFGLKIRVMPDVHAGAGCTIGTTMTIKDKVAPSLVGIDIGCGMETVKLKEKEIDFEKLDQLIRSQIPAGREIRNTLHPLIEEIDLTELCCLREIDLNRASLSLGTLGGGNHFIEVDRDEEGFLYLVVHSGSRYLGVQTEKHYQRLGWNAISHLPFEARRDLIQEYKAQGRQREIEKGLQELEKNYLASFHLPEEYAYVEGENLKNYVHDMGIVQRYAALNRQAMVQTILEGMGLGEIERFTTIHNYIDTQRMILRKGAVSAQKGEKLLIPINMRDGALLCIGKGNPDWNFSAPHGAGRILSRGKARCTLTLEEYRQQMKGIYTTCVTESTLDESPMAYRGLDAILSQIGPTAEVIGQIRPLYNFKAEA